MRTRRGALGKDKRKYSAMEMVKVAETLCALAHSWMFLGG